MGLEFGALLAEWRTAVAEFEADDDPDAEDSRYITAWRYLFRARPTDPGDLAAQLRWLISELQHDSADRRHFNVLRHVARQLEAMALGKA